ncbi:MAG: hypothetical protein ACE5GV_07640, partial [Candidatus Scalindua sp.]
MISGQFKGKKESESSGITTTILSKLAMCLLQELESVFRKNKPLINQVVRLFDYASGQEFALRFKGVRAPATQTNLKTIGYHFSHLYSFETKLNNLAYIELTYTFFNCKENETSKNFCWASIHEIQKHSSPTFAIRRRFQQNLKFS